MPSSLTEQQFRELFETNYDRLCRYAVRLGHDRSEAEDLVQGVFLAVWANPSSTTRARSLAAYLHGAVRHASLNTQRHERTVRRIQELATAEAWSPGSGTTFGEQPDESAEYLELSAAVAAAIALLPARGREAFLLHRESQLSYAEIGLVMQVSEKTVKTHISRALASLAERLAGWRTPSVGADS